MELWPPVPIFSVQNYHIAAAMAPTVLSATSTLRPIFWFLMTSKAHILLLWTISAHRLLAVNDRHYQLLAAIPSIMDHQQWQRIMPLGILTRALEETSWNHDDQRHNIWTGEWNYISKGIFVLTRFNGWDMFIAQPKVGATMKQRTTSKSWHWVNF